MVRGILGVVAGLAVWLMTATVAGILMRVSWPDYARVAGSMTFTLTMMIARLSIGALATVAAGVVTRVIARSTIATLIPGVLLLVAFVPEHVALWDRFPVWYHLTFLLSLVPLTYAGGRLMPGGSGSRSYRPGAIVV